MPSMENSTVVAANENIDVVILRDNYNEILGHYQHLGNLNFFRLDKE